MSDRLTRCLIFRPVHASARKRTYSAGETNVETSTERDAEREVTPHRD
jgi:hypothetical protein